jgi:DNA-binding beta-propeller fold protein YncE
MISGQARALLAEAGAALAVSALIAGCGNNYRPVVTPITSSGPPAQVQSYVVTVSSPSPSSPGVATIIDYSGDTILAQAPIGVGPFAFSIDETGSTGYTINSDGTLTNFPISSSLQAKQVFQSTLPFTAMPVNMMAPQSGLWAADLDGDVADDFTGSPAKLQLSIPVGTAALPATMPVSVFGPPSQAGQRNYVLSQNVPDTAPMTCNTPQAAVPANGVATGIEISSSVADTPIVLDPFAATGSLNARCPVYAVMSPDQRRFFVLNRASDTISVINSQNDTLDECVPFKNQNGQLVNCHPILPLSLTAVNALSAACAATGPPPCSFPIAPPNGTTGMTAVAGPLYAEYNAATQQLVVANYDGGSVSVIDVSLDEYGNDSPTFGTTYTIPVGNTATPGPASVTVLADGSKAYTANQNDAAPGQDNGTVTVINLSTHTVEKTLTVVGHPRTVASTQNSSYSKVYVASPDSPFITVLESTPTVSDQLDTTILLEGNVVDLRVTTQNGSSGNANFTSRVPGYGQPCNLPGEPAPTGTQTLLQACQAIP